MAHHFTLVKRNFVLFFSFCFHLCFSARGAGDYRRRSNGTSRLVWGQFFGRRGGLIGKSYRQWAPDDVSLSTDQLCSPTDAIFPIFVSRIKFYCLTTSRFPAFFYRTAMIEFIFRNCLKVKIADNLFDVDRFRQKIENIFKENILNKLKILIK
jgi:hypothetical protein